jgi:hypothetical protein
MRIHWPVLGQARGDGRSSSFVRHLIGALWAKPAFAYNAEMLAVSPAVSCESRHA